MTPSAFGKLALSMPEAEASSHFDVPDYRVGDKIFATAGRMDGKAVLKLTLDQQQILCEAEPDMFHPVESAWGRKGWTNLVLAKADVKTARSALWMAWKNVAPKKLLKAHVE
ncbi:MAG: MmcQ/YjbR family DNA-binding protein [Hyphomonadaceae bacterium]